MSCSYNEYAHESNAFMSCTAAVWYGNDTFSNFHNLNSSDVPILLSTLGLNGVRVISIFNDSKVIFCFFDPLDPNHTDISVWQDRDFGRNEMIVLKWNALMLLVMNTYP